MSFLRYVDVIVASDGVGAGTGDTEYVNGKLECIQYVKDNYDNGVDVAITGATTGVPLWSKSNVDASEVAYPRRKWLNATTGVAAADAFTYCYIDDEAIRVTVSSAGDTKSGTFRFWVS